MYAIELEITELDEMLKSLEETCEIHALEQMLDNGASTNTSAVGNTNCR